MVRRRVVNLGHHVFELRVCRPVEDDAAAPSAPWLRTRTTEWRHQPSSVSGASIRQLVSALGRTCAQSPGVIFEACLRLYAVDRGGEVQDDVVRLLLLVEALAVRVLLVHQRRSADQGV